MISEQDPRGRIRWVIDFPGDDAFVPFLDTEVKITPDEKLKTGGTTTLTQHCWWTRSKKLIWTVSGLPQSNKKKNKRKDNTEYRAPLKLPYLSEGVSNKIRNYVKSIKLPVRIIFTQAGNSLQQRFCSSRPFDKPACVLGNPKKCLKGAGGVRGRFSLFDCFW